MKNRSPNAAPYILTALALAAAIWTALGSPHSERPVTKQLAHSSMVP
ncbi:hypothetical protein AAFX91_03050 [Bradyrhizobium sp. 31Argb]|nr:hypothetical protein [Bradyrhizobium sp. Arg237L]MDI4236045.1 hypothetical protein [Bradyrhizobium sp. Arg237L]